MPYVCTYVRMCIRHGGVSRKIMAGGSIARRNHGNCIHHEGGVGNEFHLVEGRKQSES